MKNAKRSVMVVVVGVSLSAVFLSGCASMFSGKTQEVKFTSRPQGAEILVGTQTCTTPCTLQLKKDKMFLEISATKPGFQKEKMNVIGSFDPYGYLNVFTWGIGFVVDYVGGSYVKYEPEYLVQLEKK